MENIANTHTLLLQGTTLLTAPQRQTQYIPIKRQAPLIERRL
jgi:hypothetical protein